MVSVFVGKHCFVNRSQRLSDRMLASKAETVVLGMAVVVVAVAVVVVVVVVVVEARLEGRGHHVLCEHSTTRIHTKEVRQHVLVLFELADVDAHLHVVAAVEAICATSDQCLGTRSQSKLDGSNRRLTTISMAPLSRALGRHIDPRARIEMATDPKCVLFWSMSETLKTTH